MEEARSSSATEAGPPRYHVQEEIATGGTARIFRAWDGQLHRMVALKRLQPGSIGLGANQTAWTEAMTMASVQHPNIVTIYDFGQDDEGAFVVMELVEGMTLDAVIARGVMTLDDFSILVQQTLDALVAAHHAGLIHRDLKGANVMLAWLPSGSFQIKILDFGLAKLLAAPQSQTIEQDGSLIGSIATMSPEQLNRQPIDERSDLYAIGCVFYFALAGRLPFGGDTVAEVVASHLQHHVDAPLEEVRPDLPLAVPDWVMTLINVNPQDRFQSARQALASYARLMHAASEDGVLPGTAASADSPGHILEKAPRSMAAIATALVLLAAAAIGFGVYKMKSAAQEQPAAPAQSPETTEHHKKRPPGVYSGKDVDALRALVGKNVTVESNVDEMSDGKNGDMRYLKYDHSFRKGVSLAFPLSKDTGGNFAAEKLQAYVGRRVRASGTLEDNQGHLQIVVENLNQLQIVPE